jgi:superoxide dismutase
MDLPAEVRTAVRNHGGGHLNHTIFWNTMSPAGGEPTGELNSGHTIRFRFCGCDERAIQQRSRNRLWQWMGLAGIGQ